MEYEVMLMTMLPRPTEASATGLFKWPTNRIFVISTSISKIWPKMDGNEADRMSNDRFKYN